MVITKIALKIRVLHHHQKSFKIKFRDYAGDLENKDAGGVRLEHCLSTGNLGEFAGSLRAKSIVFLERRA